MSEKKAVESFSTSENLIIQIHRLIEYSPHNPKSKSECYVDFFKKLLFDNCSPNPSEKPQSDIPLETDSLQKRAENNPALKTFIENVNRPETPPPCQFSSSDIDPKTREKVYFCDNPRRTQKKAPVRIALDSCLKCFERRQFVKDHKSDSTPRREELPDRFCPRDAMYVYPRRCLTCDPPCGKYPRPPQPQPSETPEKEVEKNGM